MTQNPPEKPSFGEGGTPSWALINAALRNVANEPGLALGEDTVAHFCEQLRKASRLLSDLPFTHAPHDRAESFRYLLSLLSFTVDAGVLGADPLEPMFSPPYRTHLLDSATACPDGVYRRAFIRDDRCYRLSGRLGNADYFSIDYRLSPKPCAIGREEIVADSDGAFELFVGGPQRERNWWPLIPGTQALVVREFFADWAHAKRSLLRIECLDGAQAPRAEHNAARVAAEFDVIADWILEGAIKFWIDQTNKSVKNGFRPDFIRGRTKLPVTTHGVWELGPDEALLVEFTDPEARFWGLQLASSLWHTLDYANRLTTYNNAQTDPDRDGVFRLVLAHEDPGICNWLDTMGLACGVMAFRSYRAEHLEAPRTRLLKQSEIAGALPNARRCGPEERRRQIAERRNGVAHLLCD